MTLKEAKQSVEDLKSWVNGLQPKHFQANGPSDETNTTSLTEMQAGLTEVNTKIGHLLFKITTPSDADTNNDPNAESKKGKPSGQQPANQKGLPPGNPAPPIVPSRKPDANNA